jgi:hypothetical protein
MEYRYAKHWYHLLLGPCGLWQILLLSNLVNGGQEEVSENPQILTVNKHDSARVAIRRGSYGCSVFSVQQKCV